MLACFVDAPPSSSESFISSSIWIVIRFSRAEKRPDAASLNKPNFIQVQIYWPFLNVHYLSKNKAENLIVAALLWAQHASGFRV